ncbi:FtsW/RodA/SpoVE family cell cycle protein [Sulfurovum riftiae]|uniref:Probable peptidoglycan glycosyltransferase FtsW n=1 Tax=Sulfurovum riftiae TaxID=1630136 RepID=A0A151CGR7_9BACT|nr:FtsW/RodA/SpoVE family cell cycle protein [Sulfurovum riftiae]KYJ86697.1 cell division protein [Sulfurovum riftiae]
MIDKPLLAAVIALLTLSMVMSYSLSTYTVLHFHFSDFHFFFRQSISIFIAFTSMVILSKLDPDKWFAPVGLTLFLVFFLLMLAMQFMPASLVKAVGGAKRWIHVGPISLAPVEFFKVGFIFFLAWSFSRKFSQKNHMGFIEELRSFMPYIIVFLAAVVIIAIFQKDLGQVVVLGATLMVMFLFVGSSWKFFLTMLTGIFMAFIGLIFFAPHRMARIKSWWSTVQDSILSVLPFEQLETLRVETTAKEPYQISNSLNAIHNGGIFGQGLGNGQFKLGYLSEVHTDFILAGITEELGYLGLALVTLTMLFIVFRIFKIASKVKNPMYYLFSIGVGLLISFAFILNAYGISGITPIKGIAVPFLSYGGSHIIAACVAIGMVLMISKKVPRDRNGKML